MKNRLKILFFQYQSGFTLIEMMIVIGVIGILSAIAIPNFINSLPDYRLRSATRDIVSCMQEAKLRAVKDNARVVIIFNQNSESYVSFIDSVPPGGNWALDGTETIVKQVTLPSGIDIQSNPNPFPPPANFTYTYGFNNRGLSANTGGTIQMINNKLNYSRVVINFAGNIRTEQSSDGTNWN
jgi:type IV fimbrial biogenesis protein FimT